MEIKGHCHRRLQTYEKKESGITRWLKREGKLPAEENIVMIVKREYWSSMREYFRILILEMEKVHSRFEVLKFGISPH